MRRCCVLFCLAGCPAPAPSHPSAPHSSPAEPPRAEVLLVVMDAWTPGETLVAPDPLAAERPPGAGCPPGGSALEGSTFEIDTGLCTWAWFQQPALADLRPGDLVEVSFRHSALVADPPAVGHLALWVGDQLLYEVSVDIPAATTPYTEVVEVVSPAEAGAVVTLHLDNHGSNTWTLLRIRRLAAT